MDQTLEALERAIIGNGPRLIDRTIGERDGPDAVRLVRRIVLLAGQIEGGLDYIVNSAPWVKFTLLYPSEAEPILKDARNGIIDSK